MASSLPFVMKNVLGVCFSFFLPSGELVSNFAPSASSSPGNTMLWKVHKETVAALPIIYVESLSLITTAIFWEFTDWAHTQDHKALGNYSAAGLITGLVACCGGVFLQHWAPAPVQAVVTDCTLVAIVGWHFKHTQKWKRMLKIIIIVWCI